MLMLNAHDHLFAFDSSHFLRYRDGQGHELTFPYKQKGLRLSASPWTGELRVRLGRSSASLSPLSPEQLQQFLREFFTSWNRENPEAAKKAAFDYIDAQRGFVALAFVACLIVGLPIAVGMLADSHQNFSCTKELEQHSALGTMNVTKAKKKDSRNYVLEMEFTAPNGHVIKGNDQVLTKDASDLPKTFPVVYSPERPECWSLTVGLDSKEVNWAKRRYFAYFTFLFGMFFLSVSLLGLAWTVALKIRPRPFKQEVAEVFGLSS